MGMLSDTVEEVTFIFILVVSFDKIDFLFWTKFGSFIFMLSHIYYFMKFKITIIHLYSATP